MFTLVKLFGILDLFWSRRSMSVKINFKSGDLSSKDLSTLRIALAVTSRSNHKSKFLFL